jgi:hypothetical protein
LSGQRGGRGLCGADHRSCFQDPGPHPNIPIDTRFQSLASSLLDRSSNDSEPSQSPVYAHATTLQATDRATDGLSIHYADQQIHLGQKEGMGLVQTPWFLYRFESAIGYLPLRDLVAYALPALPSTFRATRFQLDWPQFSPTATPFSVQYLACGHQ